MKKKDIIIISLIAVVVIVLASISYFASSKSKTTSKKGTEKYSAYTVPSPQTIFLEGEFQNVQKITYQPDATKGTVDSINVADKQAVTKDTVLFTYKNSQILDQVSTLEDQLDTLKATYVKLDKQSKNPISNQTLLSGNNSAQLQGSSDIKSQLDDNKKQQQKLNNQITELNNKAYTSIKAPFNGTVIKLNNDNNDLTKQILTLATPKMQLVSNVSEKDILKLSLNQTVDVTLVSTGQVVKGKITFISTTPVEASIGNISSAQSGSMQASSGSNSSYAVYIDVENQQEVYPGFHAQISATSAKDYPKIPKTSTFSEDGATFVWNISDGTLKKVKVETADFNEKYVQVKSGLNFDDKVIREAKDTMKEGDKVDNSTN